MCSLIVMVKFLKKVLGFDDIRLSAAGPICYNITYKTAICPVLWVKINIVKDNKIYDKLILTQLNKNK